MNKNEEQNRDMDNDRDRDSLKMTNESMTEHARHLPSGWSSSTTLKLTRKERERWSFMNITLSDLLVLSQTNLSRSFLLIQTYSPSPSLYCMGCRDILLTFSVALLLISLFQIWLFREGQVRELSEDNQVGKDVNTLASKNKKDNVQRIFHRYFKGLNNSNSRFEDSYRQIPSSPDRLHN